ncbi:MAG: hypothetical protein P8P83_04060 [Rickettsiaceae bacterium]|nr:hypothetical protein [Rickettsiaceae bacterium]
MRNILVLLALFFSFTQSFAEIRTYERIDTNSDPSIYLRDNISSSRHVFATAHQVNNNALIVNTEHKDLQTTFLLSPLEVGDKIILNTTEQKLFNVTLDLTPKKDEMFGLKKYFYSYKQNKSENLYPCLLFTKKDNEKKYGFISESNLESLQKIDNRKPVSAQDLLSYKIDQKLTVIYAILPKDRTQEGYVIVKHHGEWVKDKNGERLSFKVLGRSKTNNEQATNYRLHKDSDTPQGIYIVNGVMNHSNSPIFGNGPYLDIDNITISPGRYGYLYDRFLLESLLPIEATNDYWANEFNLAQSLGRYAIRVHGNNSSRLKELNLKDDETILSTAGCLNLGSNQPKFMKLLADLKMIDLDNYAYEVELNKGTDIFSWNVSSKIGLVYLIVKDEE